MTQTHYHGLWECLGGFPPVAAGPSPFCMGPPAPHLHFISKQSAGELLKPVQAAFPHQVVKLSTVAATQWGCKLQKNILTFY